MDAKKHTNKKETGSADLINMCISMILINVFYIYKYILINIHMFISYKLKYVLKNGHHLWVAVGCYPQFCSEIQASSQLMILIVIINIIIIIIIAVIVIVIVKPIAVIVPLIALVVLDLLFLLWFPHRMMFSLQVPSSFYPQAPPRKGLPGPWSRRSPWSQRALKDRSQRTKCHQCGEGHSNRR